jgi:16S rRNA (cytidine1402-2'-O)-methyltransferase
VSSQQQNESKDQLAAGLYIVATPIGNLQDITLRALHVLRTCSIIAAEDTRRVRKLLNHFDIHTKTLSYRDHNRAAVEPQLLDRIIRGEAVALVSDAGTPVISDPGSTLAMACEDKGLPVFVIPGPSALTAAIARAGIGGDGFVFAGFPPAKRKQRLQFFEQHSHHELPLVFYEAPHRILKSLEDLRETSGDIDVWLLRELTKIHEEMLHGSVKEVSEELSRREEIKGEFTVIAAPQLSKPDKNFTDDELEGMYNNLLESGKKPKEALKLLAKHSGRSRNELYTLLRL